MCYISAIVEFGVVYVCAFRSYAMIRGFLLLATIVPITIVANFIRVFALVLIAYYGGIEVLEGIVHDLTGIGLFIVAVALMFLFDGLLSLLAPLFKATLRFKSKSETGGDAARKDNIVA